MMESLVEKLSRRLLPIDQLKQELDAVLPKEKQKGYQLPWIEAVKRIFSRAADSASEILFENVCKIIEVNLEKTVQRALKNSKRDGHLYCAPLTSFISHIQYSVKDTDLPVAEINKLNVHLLSAVTDIESATVRSGEEPAAVSRIFLKLTLMLGYHPEYIIDTLLHCKTLLYASARQPLIYVPLIKRVFTSLKNKSPQSPHLYLKYLLIGKLWLFMTKKEEVGKTRMYIINSVKLPKTFVDWAVQNKIPWLKLRKWNSKLILRSMTVSSALRTLYSDYKPLSSQWDACQNSKKRKREDITKAHNHRTKQGKVLLKKNRTNVEDQTKFKLEQKVQENTNIKPVEEVYLLTGKMKENMHEFDTLVNEKHETKMGKRFDISTHDIKKELVKTQGKKMLQDAPSRIKKGKTHDIREREREMKAGGKKEDLVDSGQIKILMKKNFKIERDSSGKKRKAIANENNMKLDQLKVLDKRWKGKNSKNVETRICRENEIDETQVRKGSTSNQIFEKASTSHGASEMRKYDKREKLRLTKHKDAIRKRIRRNSITFTVTDLNPVVKSLKVECEGRCKDDRKQGENKEVYEETVNDDFLLKERGSNQASVSFVDNGMADENIENDTKVYNELLDRHHKVFHDSYISESDLPGSLHISVSKSMDMSSGKDLAVKICNNKVKVKLDDKEAELIDLASELSHDNEASGKTGDDERVLLIESDVKGKELDRCSNGNDSEIKVKSHNLVQEIDGESENDVVQDLENQEVKQLTRVLGRVANKACEINENKAYGKAGDEESELEIISESSGEELDCDSDSSNREVESESDGLDEELNDSSDGELEVFDNGEIKDQENETVILHEVKQPTEKLTKVITKSGEPTEILETFNESSVPPDVYVENSDSDIEILHMDKADPKVSKVRKDKPIVLKGFASDIDEASGSDSDIIPCDEKTKMFTDEETKNYHNRLMEAVMQRKVENILKEEEKELKRKRVEDEKTKSINLKTESQKTRGNNTENETIDKKATGSEDLVSQMMNKLYKPSAYVKSIEVEEPSDFESDDDSDIEVVLQTIVKDTGRMTSIHGLREKLLNSSMVKEEPDESDREEKHYEKNKETEVLENPVNCHEKFKERSKKETEAPDNKKFKETEAQEIEEINDDGSVRSENEKFEHFSDKPKNKNEEVQVVEQGVDIKPKEVNSVETEVLHNIVNHTEKSQKSEERGMEIYNNIFDQNDIDNSMLLKSGNMNETQMQAGKELNVELKNSGIDLQIAYIGSLERDTNLNLVSCHSTVEEVDASFLPNTSSPVLEENDDNKYFSLKQEIDDRLEPICNLELNEKQFSLEVSDSEESGIYNFAQSVDKGKEKEIESDVNQTVKIKVHPDAKVVKDEVIKEDSISVIEGVASVRGNETIVKPSSSYVNVESIKDETIESEGNYENDHPSSISEKHVHNGSITDVHNFENSSSTEVDSPIMERLRINEDSAEELKSIESETVSSKRSEVKESAVVPRNVPDSIKSVAQNGKDLGTMNTELDFLTEKSEEKSIKGSAKDYEASSNDEVIKEERICVIEGVASVRGNETVVKPSSSYESEALESEGNHDNDKQSSASEKHAIADIHNFENGSSSTEVYSPTMERLRISLDSAEEFKSKESETVSSKRSEVKESAIVPWKVSDSINSVAQNGKDIGTMNTELDSVTEESEEKSIEGANEDYEASSDASEDLSPRIRRRTRSLRRSFTHTFMQEASDSDASPEQRTLRIRRTSDMTRLIHLGPPKKRSRSSCLDMANSVSGASGSVQSSQTLLSDSSLDEKLTACTKKGTSSGFASLCESDFSTNSQNVLDAGNNVDASNTSLLTVDTVNRLHTVPYCTAKPSESGAVVLMENVRADGTSNSVFSLKLQNTSKGSTSHTPARRSARLFEKTTSQQKRQFIDAFGGSDSISGVALDGGPAEVRTRVLTRRSVRCTKSDSGTVLGHSVQLLTKNGKASSSHTLLDSVIQVKNCGPHEHENILGINKEGGYNCNISPVAKNFSPENLSSNNLLSKENNDTCQDIRVIGKSGNQTEYFGKRDTMVINILSSNAPQKGEEEQQELAGKVCKKIQKSQKSGDDYLHVVDVEGKSSSSIDIVKDKDHASATKEHEEYASSEVNEQKKEISEIETSIQDQNRVEEYLDEKEGEELEVLSTSGMMENDLCCNFSADASPSDSEEHENIMNEKADTPLSQKPLRSLSRHRSCVKSGKEINLDVKRDDSHPSIPPLKVHCVSEAVLAKEVLISPEVSDEECELVSPGVDNEVDEAESLPLPEDLETTPKQKPSPIIIPSHSVRKKNGGIRSPQKMIPEEQDETTLLRYKVENVSSPSQTPRIKSTSTLGMQEKVKTKTSCTFDKNIYARKLSKTSNEIHSVILSDVIHLKSKSPSRNKACSTDVELSPVVSPRKKLTSNGDKFLVEKVSDELAVTKIGLIEKSNTTLENVAEIIDRSTVQSVRNTRSSKHKEILNGSPDTSNYHTTNNYMVINIGSSEKSITYANVNASITKESSVNEESGLRLSSGRKSSEKGLDDNFALEATNINEKVKLENEDVKSVENEAQPQKEEEKVDQHLEIPNKCPTSLNLSRDGSVLRECSSVSSSELSSPLRRSLRLKRSGQTPSYQIHGRRKAHRIDNSTLIGTLAEEGEPVEVLPEKCNTSPGLARMDELTSRSGTQMTSGSSQLTMKILPRTMEPAAWLCKKNGSPSESSSRTDKSPDRLSSKKKESQTRLSVKEVETLTSSSQKLETVTGLSTKNEDSSAWKFVRCATSLGRSSPRLCRRYTDKDELRSKEESRFRSSSWKKGSSKRLSFNRSNFVRSPSTYNAKSSTRQDDGLNRSSHSLESSARFLSSLMTQMSLSSTNDSPCNENISKDKSSVRMNQSPTRPVRSSTIKNRSLARSFCKKDKSGLSISGDIPQMRSSPKNLPGSSFCSESSARLSSIKSNSLAGSPSLQSKISLSLSKDESQTRSPLSILSPTKLSLNDKSPSRSSQSKSPVRSGVSKNESPVRSSSSSNPSPVRSSSSESPAMVSSSKTETQTKSSITKIESPTKSASCKDESSANLPVFSDSSSCSKPVNDDDVAALVGIRSLRHRRVTYSVTPRLHMK